jgi:hypothetical protein
MSKKKETHIDPLTELVKQCHAIGLKSYYELTCHHQSKKLGVNVFREETYQKFLGRLPDKILGFDVEYKFARKFQGQTYER